MSVFIDIHTIYNKGRYQVYGIGRGGSVDYIYDHRPWFVAHVKDNVQQKFASVVEGLIKKGLVVDYRIVDPNEKLPIVQTEEGWLEVGTDYKVVEVFCKRKEVVPVAAANIKKLLPTVIVGEHNIVYPVRVAFDLDIKFFHRKCPVLYAPNSELEPIAYEIIERYRDFKIMSFDIEVYTSSSRFPVPGDPVLSIQYSVTTLSNPDVSDPNWVKDNVTVMVAQGASKEESEELVSKFIDVIRREKPDVVVGYNSAAFDLKYIKPFIGYMSNIVLREPSHINLVDTVFPHVDLFIVRRNMGSSLGIRSQTAVALDDVVRSVASGTKFEWVLSSRYMDAESRLDHVKLVREWEARSQLFFDYVTADAYFTLILAYEWMYTLILLSALTQIPLSQTKLNLGQVAEYNIVHWLERLGFSTPVLVRQAEFRKVKPTAATAFRVDDVYTKGKVYVKDFGVFTNVVEGDFAQLYPSLMANDAVDPIFMRVLEVRRPDIVRRDPMLSASPGLAGKRFTVVLGSKPKKSADYMVPSEVVEAVASYGPVSFMLYKMYTMRKITKKLKKVAESTGRHELVSVDQAVKILNNASYGAMSKRRGFINPVLSGYVFWKTLRIFYDVIEYAEKELKVTVLYGDTDSVFVKCREDEATRMYPQDQLRDACFKWFSNTVVPKINEYVKKKYGREFELSPEGAFDICVYPKSKHENAPSRKSYICANVEGGNVVVDLVKGEFFKVVAPEGVKERLGEIYAEILSKKPKGSTEVMEILRDVLSRQPPHKYFIKKTVSTFESDRIPDGKHVYTFKLKKLNKPHHYAVLHSLFVTYETVPEVRASNTIQVLSNVSRLGGSRSVIYVIDAERLLRERGSVVVYIIPSDDPTKFMMFVDYDEKSDTVTVHNVSVRRVDIVTERVGDTAKDVGYRVEETYTVLSLPRTKILADAVKACKKFVVDDITKKLLPTLHKRTVLGDGS